jgi:hypothetical protein
LPDASLNVNQPSAYLVAKSSWYMMRKMVNAISTRKNQLGHLT